MGKRKDYNKSKAENRKQFTGKPTLSLAERMTDGAMKVAERNIAAAKKAAVQYTSADFNFLKKQPATFAPINGVQAAKEARVKSIAEQAAEAARARAKRIEDRKESDKSKRISDAKKERAHMLATIKENGCAKSLRDFIVETHDVQEDCDNSIDKLKKKVESLEKRDSQRYMEKMAKKSVKEKAAKDKADRRQEKENDMKEMKRRLRKLDDESIERAEKKAAKKKAAAKPKSGPGWMSKLRGTYSGNY